MAWLLAYAKAAFYGPWMVVPLHSTVCVCVCGHTCGMCVPSASSSEPKFFHQKTLRSIIGRINTFVRATTPRPRVIEFN
uniref:Putative secreted protein n=1 Tax=Anopheles darlingi TaxID=43151 RepID=A0A2M4DDG7_ANODA